VSACAADSTRADGGLRLYLRALFGLDAAAFVEIAHRYERNGRKGPMHRGRTGAFRPARDLEAIALEIERLAREEHVWVGVVPRRPDPKTGELGGTKSHAAPARVLWVDCDANDGASARRIQEFRPPPHLVVGSGGGHHAYWLLRDPLDDSSRLREANRLLARALGGDPQAVDAARILRPPGTLNFKTQYGRPRAVELVLADRHPRYRLDEVVGRLPPRPRAHRHRTPAEPSRRRADPLQRIAPALYFRELAGVEPDRGGKVCCPLPDHDDPEPSCHVYETPAQGWYCYGCGHGGDVYELAGALWGFRREGCEFVQLRHLLEKRFGIERVEWPRRTDRGRAR
jgi:RepB DNA-primase from phage plasmid